MEHYFIYICDGNPTPEEHNTIHHYIKTSLPSNICHKFSSINSVPLLKCRSSYMAVVNTCSKEEAVEWAKEPIKTLNQIIIGFKEDNSQPALEEDTSRNVEVLKEVSSSISKNFEDSNRISADLNENSKKTSDDFEDINKTSIKLDESPIRSDDEKVLFLSKNLNSLADELPINGTYKLDVIISQKICKALCSWENLECAGSLYRLFRWHMAHIAIVAPSEGDALNLESFYEILDVELIKGEIDPLLGPVIWRGSIQFKNPNVTYLGFHLRLDSLESEITFDDVVAPADLETDPYEHLTLSPSFQVMQECSFSSIPIYLIVPIAFRLYVCETSICNENSKKLLKGFSSHNDTALIVRLKYSILHEKPKPDKSLSTSRWQKMLSSACIRDPDTNFPILDKYLTFVITSSSKSGHVVAYPLRDPSSLDAKFYFSALDQMESKSKGFNADTFEKNLLRNLEVPYLPQEYLYALVNKINHLGLNSKEPCKGEHSSTDDCCLESLLASVAKRCLPHSWILGYPELHVTEEEIDPSDWPERIHLLQKQIQIEKEKTNVQPNVFRNLSPRRSQSTISFTCQDVQKYFLPTGEPKDGANINSKPVVTNDSKPMKQDLDKQHSKWPEALTVKEDDIYYNCDKQAEDKEAVGNEMVRFYVQHDTACTCNNQQFKTDPTIFIRTKSKQPSLKYRSPSAPRFVSRIKKSNSQLDASLSQSNVSSSKLKRNGSVLSVENVNNISKRKRKLPVKKNVQPVRSSPRKMNTVKYSQSAARTTTEPKKKTYDPQQLPEIMKKKLRVAVASALEKNGINLKDAFFRPCGKRLFAICQAFVPDISRQKGSVSQHMQRIADAHVKQVIEFERQREAES